MAGRQVESAGVTKVQLQPQGADRMVLVEVDSAAPSQPDGFSVRIEGRTIPVTFASDGRGEGRLLIHGRVVPFYAIRRQETIHLWVLGRTYAFKVVDGQARRQAGTGTAAFQDRLTAPMPGTVLKINVKVGDAFESHQPLIVMESMKMEMTLSAPHGGRVKSIACREGQLVEMGAALVEFEESSSEARREADDAKTSR